MKKETLNAVLTAHAKARAAAERYYNADIVERSDEAPSDESIKHISAEIERIETVNKTLPEIQKFLKDLAVSDAEVYRALHYYILEGVPLVKACEMVSKTDHQYILKRVQRVFASLK